MKTFARLLIPALLLLTLMPQACLFAAQSDSVVIRVRVLDSPPQGTITINGGAEYTSYTEVTLTLSAHDAESSVDKMQFSSDGVNWSAPEDYAATKSWALTADDGAKTVSVKFSDKAGNWSDPCQASIILDTKPITARGTNFIYHGRNFHYVGANTYYLMVYTAWQHQFADEIFDDAKAMGMTVMRTWAFNDDVDIYNWNTLQTAPGVFDERVFQALDYVVAAAARRNIKLILAFTDYWGAYGGMDQYVQWDQQYGSDGHVSSSLYDFYTDSDIRQWFKNFIATVLNRTNTITGVKYRDDPTVFAWELANEPRGAASAAGRENLRNWAREMSEHIKSIDPNHMVSIGSEGFYNKEPNGSDPNRNGSYGTDFIRDNQLSAIDFATLHLWPEKINMTFEESMAWLQEHIDDASTVLAKPLIIEEFGKLRDGGGATTARDTYFQNYLDKAYASGIGGANFWILYHDTYQDYDGYGVYYPRDASTCSIISQAAARVNSIRSPPDGLLRINGGALYTSSRSVILNISGQGIEDGLAFMQFSNDGVTWSGQEPYDPQDKAWDLSGSDGRKIVYARFKTNTGNWLDPICDTIILDLTPPYIVFTDPADGACLNTPQITAHYTSDGIPKTKDFTLSEGENTLSIEEADEMGNVGSASIKVILDTMAPAGSIAINSVASYTNSQTVMLNLPASDNAGGSGLDKMRLENGIAGWMEPEPYNQTRQLALPAGDGAKTVSVKFSDRAGNWSEVYSADIIVDTVSPTIVITNPQDNAIVNISNITVNYTLDGAAKSKQITLQEGLNTVTITETDAAGNTGTAQIRVTLDTKAPVVVITSPQNDAVFDTPDITVNYTVDGAPGSRQLTLIKGANTITITETDGAGNQSSATIVAHYNPGTPVTPDEGATVTSPDGEALVEIPAGAIETVSSISVTNLNPNNYDSAAPQDYDAQGVAAFGPDGQQFAKPVTIRIPLDKAQIPGSEVDLGILNKTTGNFDLMGEKMTVNADGKSASAQVTHFSTYGALKNLISTGAAIGGGAEIPLPDLFTGAFSHQIRIETPPGRKGMEPNIALLYRSNLRNGWLGYGWDLNPGYIERDIKAGAPSYKDAPETLDLGDGSDGELNVTSGTTIINGTKNYTRVYIGPNATVTCDAWNGSSGGSIIIKCQGEAKIEGTINVDGKGYRGLPGGNYSYQKAQGPGGGWAGHWTYEGGGGRGSAGGGGGGYGATGGSGGGFGGWGQGGSTYGDSDIAVLELGSGGGNGGPENSAQAWRGGEGGTGGGAIKITANSVIVSGTITANGTGGSMSNGTGGGGGSGGSIYIKGYSVNVTGACTVRGGDGPGDAGEGGQGRILITEPERKDSFLYSSTGSRMDLINLIQNVYQSKIESGFVKFYKQEDGFWHALQKDGMKLYFGTAAGSKMTNSKGTYRWLLDKIEDTNGNYLTLSYTQDSGQVYISNISYTGNSTTGAAPTHTVDFILEDRTDKIVSSSSGSVITTAKRLKEIDVKAQGTLARKYVFNYTYSPDTGRSLLTSVDQYGSDGLTKFPTMTFKYRGR